MEVKGKDGEVSNTNYFCFSVYALSCDGRRFVFSSQFENVSYTRNYK